jgi:hypothetical protein
MARRDRLFGGWTPFATDVGIEVLKGPRDYAKVKRALAEAGYNGERIVVMAPTDVHELGNLTRTGRAASARRDKRRPAGDGFRQRDPSPRQPRPAGCVQDIFTIRPR